MGLLQEEDLKDFPAALESYRAAVASNPDDMEARQLEIRVELKQGMKREALAPASAMLDLRPTDPDTYRAVMAPFREADARAELLGFFEQRVSTNKGNWQVVGATQFHIGILHLDLDETALAHKAFRDAAKSLHKVFPKDHPVFKVIDEELRKARP